MALRRRSTNRFQSSIWPGFVDAMTGLLLVLMFVLTIFTVVQFVLRDTISGQETELDSLTGEVATLARALGLAEDRNAALAADLETASAEAAQQSALIASLTAERDVTAAALSEAQNRITGFEAQVAGLLAQRQEAQAAIAGLEAAQAAALSEAEALNLALAQARTEIDAEAEAARLAAARADALDAMVAQMAAEAEASEAEIAALAGRVDAAAEALTEAEAARLADAAAAEALRARLQGADAELSAMTLALEQQRRAAEETLTLLAAAEAAQARAEADLTREMTEAERQAALLAQANQALSAEEALSADSLREVAALTQQVAALRRDVAELQSLLNLANQADASSQVEITALGTELNTALARVAAEERRRREAEEELRLRSEAERLRLEAEAQDLARYRSEFFGRMREIVDRTDGIRIVGDRFVFSSEVLFEPGAADLSPAGAAEIANVAALLRAIAADIPDSIDWIIRVDGHTDTVPLSGAGAFADNWELSQARALSVVRYMIENQGIAPSRLAANGFGEFQPLNPADTPEARAQNRRIELKLTER